MYKFRELVLFLFLISNSFGYHHNSEIFKSKHIEYGMVPFVCSENKDLEASIHEVLLPIRTEYKKRIYSKYPILKDADFKDIVDYKIKLPSIYKDAFDIPVGLSNPNEKYLSKFRPLLHRHENYPDSLLLHVGALESLGLEYMSKDCSDVRINGSTILFKHTKKQLAETARLFPGNFVFLDSDIFSDQRFRLEGQVIAAILDEYSEPYQISKVLPLSSTFCDFRNGEDFLGYLTRKRELKKYSKTVIEALADDFFIVGRLYPDLSNISNVARLESAHTKTSSEFNLYISRVGFNRSSTHALVRVSDSETIKDGGVWFFFLRRIDAKWQVEEKFMDFSPVF